jgi:hypothetical protein
MLGFWLLLAGIAAASAIAALQKRAQLRQALAEVRDLQHFLLHVPRFRVPTEAERSEFEALRRDDIDELSRELTWLGDTVETVETVHVYVRVYVDASRTSIAYVASGALAASSYVDDRELTTTRGTTYRWAQPPFRSVSEVGSDVSTSELLQAHCARLEAITPESLQRIDTLEDVVRRWTAVHEREIAWRTNEPPDELLRKDLRALFGESYDVVDPRVLRRFAKLRARLPGARLRGDRRN